VQLLVSHDFPFDFSAYRAAPETVGCGSSTQSVSDVAVPEKPGAKNKSAKGAATPSAGGAASSKALAAPDASILFPKDGKGVPIVKSASGAFAALPVFVHHASSCQCA
jgi:hypothetical protein